MNIADYHSIQMYSTLMQITINMEAGAEMRISDRYEIMVDHKMYPSCKFLLRDYFTRRTVHGKIS